uniref:Uncharacterized protein n=2 Tax=Aegilops tauschii subsp. strangulata TaxID=200361 RepID=A0A453T0U4_AEGTS
FPPTPSPSCDLLYDERRRLPHLLGTSSDHAAGPSPVRSLTSQPHSSPITLRPVHPHSRRDVTTSPPNPLRPDLPVPAHCSVQLDPIPFHPIISGIRFGCRWWIWESTR